MMVFNARLFCSVILLVVVNLQANRWVSAQVAPDLTPQQMAVLAVDVRVDRMIEDSKKFGSPEEALNSPVTPFIDDLKPTDIKRIFGAFSAPASIEAMQAVETGGELPMEFFVRLQLTSPSACQAILDHLAPQTKEVEFSGKTFLQMTGLPVPPNVVIHQINDTTIEIGTVNYCLQPNRKLLSPRLKEIWGKRNQDDFRLVVDLKTPEALVSQAVEMGKQAVDLSVAPMVGLIDNAESLRLSFDGGSENLVSVFIEGKDSEQTEELKGGLDSLLFLARSAAPAALAGISKQVPEVGEVGTKIIDGLVAKLDANTISIVIPKPDGFEAAVGKMQEFARAESKRIQRLNNFRQVGLAVHNYDSVNGQLPLSSTNRSGIHPELSWRTTLLPFLEEVELAETIDLSKGPSEPPNAALASQMPTIFGTDGKLSNVTAIQYDQPVEQFSQIVDGTSNTVMLLENPTGQPWLENNSISIDQAVKLVSSLDEGQGLVAVMFDGSVRMLTPNIPQAELKNLFDPRDQSESDER